MTSACDEINECRKEILSVFSLLSEWCNFLSVWYDSLSSFSEIHSLAERPEEGVQPCVSLCFHPHPWFFYERMNYKIYYEYSFNFFIYSLLSIANMNHVGKESFMLYSISCSSNKVEENNICFLRFHKMSILKCVYFYLNGVTA